MSRTKRVLTHRTLEGSGQAARRQDRCSAAGVLKFGNGRQYLVMAGSTIRCTLHLKESMTHIRLSCAWGRSQVRAAASQRNSKFSQKGASLRKQRLVFAVWSSVPQEQVNRG